MKWIRRVYDWMGSKVDSPYADWWLIILFFVESSFLIIPVDPLLILYCITNTQRSMYYATVTTISSVLGGIFGYAIGALLWQSLGMVLVKWIISEPTFFRVVAKYKIYQNWAVLFAGFAPVPYKAITISAGFCHLSFIPFVVCSFIGRGARFFLVAGAIRLWGPQIKDIIDRYFNQLVIAFVFIFVACVWLFL